MRRYRTPTSAGAHAAAHGRTTGGRILSLGARAGAERRAAAGRETYRSEPRRSLHVHGNARTARGCQLAEGVARAVSLPFRGPRRRAGPPRGMHGTDRRRAAPPCPDRPPPIAEAARALPAAVPPAQCRGRRGGRAGDGVQARAKARRAARRPRRQRTKWWTERDLNPRPPACKAGILPLYYQPSAGRPVFGF